MAESFPTVADLFVKSFTLVEARDLAASGKLLYPLIAKPRNGYASRGIAIVNTASDLEKIDEPLMLQEVAIPHSDDPFHIDYVKSLQDGKNLQAAEISVQLLADKRGQIKAQCITYNKLNNGVPIEILPYENNTVNGAILRLVPFLQKKGLQGPINIQGRLTDKGFKVFEINPRFTGITGLRAAMGFNEVESCIRHWSFGKSLEGSALNPRIFGIRQTANKAIHISRNKRVERLYRKIHGDKEYNKEKPIVLVTGSTGTIGRNLVETLLQQGEFEVWTLDRSKETARNIHYAVNSVFDWHDFESGVLNFGAIDKIVHLASARPFHEAKEIADSLTKGMQIFSEYAAHGSGEIIYASSQSVYGNQPGTPWTEDLTPQPTTLYGQLKFALEQHLEGLRKVHPGISTVILRIGAVTGDDTTICQHEALARLTLRAIQEQVVEIYGGRQVLARIHYRDVVSGILQVINQHSYENHSVYNLSMKEAHTLHDIAVKVIEIVESSKPEKSISFIKHDIEEDKLKSYAIDPTCFMSKYNWRPKYSLSDIIKELVS
ncbi:NAD-dependent epimerase/dehydratase family protein [Vreelandella malpeensis]|uniref:NAD-dependent epimerase/dehydratase family protein n=1 Tax=Vreelandella malpeensis TaxID=1172368 RepID=A0ABS8DPI8_9GAMM|nr:NAD-dependent epimerase/dehydratase family protein [Halomonas malpeensis]MCB8888158.1 NAD-dependent epimerase/dehydratase family protein [Halomonas malpeensis]